MMPRSGHHRSSGHAVRHRRMSRRQRFWIFSILGVLWLTGIAWLLLDQFYTRHGEFGITPHPLQGPLLLLHGIVAILSMYMFGWIVARHVSRWWAVRRRRFSGSVFTVFLTLLSVSGFALFFLVDDASQHVAALIHDLLGLAAAAFAIQHWFFRGSQAGETTP
jgi:hypothetical protein